MLVQLLVIVATAVLSSLLTLALGWWLIETRLRPRLRAEMDRELDAALERLGTTVEARVRRGVIDAVKSIPSAEVLSGATQSAARTGAGIVGAGLGSLLGASRRRD